MWNWLWKWLGNLSLRWVNFCRLQYFQLERLRFSDVDERQFRFTDMARTGMRAQDKLKMPPYERISRKEPLNFSPNIEQRHIKAKRFPFYLCLKMADRSLYSQSNRKDSNVLNQALALSLRYFKTINKLVYRRAPWKDYDRLSIFTRINPSKNTPLTSLRRAADYFTKEYARKREQKIKASTRPTV